MTALEGIQRRAGTGVFIPPNVLQHTASPGDCYLDHSPPCSTVVPAHKRNSMTGSTDFQAPHRTSIGKGSKYGPDSSHLSCPLSGEDMPGCKTYQQSHIHKNSVNTGPTAPRHSGVRRSSGRFSIDDSASFHRTVRGGPVESVHPSGPFGQDQPSYAGNTYSNGRAAPATCSPFQSALYSQVPTSPAMMSAPRASAAQAGRAGRATRRMSVDLHSLRGAGSAVRGPASSHTGPGGVMLSPQGYRASPYQHGLGRRSFDVGSSSVSCYSPNQTAPLPSVPTASPAMASNMQAAARVNSAGSSGTRFCDPLQVQQPENWLGNSEVAQLLGSPALTAEQSLDDQIQTVLMDILDLGNQLAAAADAAGTNAAGHNSHCCHSLELQPRLAPGYNADHSILPANVAALAARPEQQAAASMPMQGRACNLAPSSADPIVSPRTSFDLLLLQQQQHRQGLSNSVPADVAGMASFASQLPDRVSSLTNSFIGVGLDLIDEDPADLTAYFLRHQQQKMQHNQFVSAALGSGTITPLLSSSPQAPMLPNIFPSSGLGDQLMTHPAGSPAAGLKPEAQAKLQELMAAQQLQLEIQNELLAMLTV